METKSHIKEVFVPVRHAASVLGLPVAFIEREAKAGRLPAVRAGRSWLIHLERARAELERRAEAGEGASR